MKIDIKKLKEATKKFEVIERLDAEIKELQTMAILIADGEKVSFEMIGTPKSRKDKPVLDSDGSLIKEEKGGYKSFMDIIMDNYKSERSQSTKSSTTINIKNDLSEKVAFQILALLLAEKQEQRNILIKQIEKI